LKEATLTIQPRGKNEAKLLKIVNLICRENEALVGGEGTDWVRFPAKRRPTGKLCIIILSNVSCFLLPFFSRVVC
jgi:hypothetical protein